jgi:hypothetical protein
MESRITIRIFDDKPEGHIVRFNVVARCPCCGNETDVTQDELSRETVQCQHCDEDFRIYLGD